MKFFTSNKLAQCILSDKESEHFRSTSQRWETQIGNHRLVWYQSELGSIMIDELEEHNPSPSDWTVFFQKPGSEQESEARFIALSEIDAIQTVLSRFKGSNIIKAENK